mgnify:CR=1 FL=1
MRRREIEKGLREGAVRAVVSTNALELGIDIGALDVSVMAGYPGTIAATWQRAGRAGRRSGRSAAVMVASSAPLDQFVVRNPSYFFDASPERALIDPDNLPHPGRSHQVRGVRAAVQRRLMTFGRRDVQEILASCSEQGARASARTRTRRGPGRTSRAPGRRRQPAVGVVGQLRHRRHHAARRA